MEITILGSSGNLPIPLPTCDCRVCTEAREKGEPYARRGNSLFVHDERILLDVPELIWHTLNRERIANVDWILLSHFHADHTLGLRVLQAIALEDLPLTDFRGEPPTLVMSPVTYERVLGEYGYFQHLAEYWADVVVLDPDERLEIGDIELTHLATEIEDGGAKAVSGYLLEVGDTTVLLTPDENRHFDLASLPEIDCWIKESGYFAETPEGDPIVTSAAAETLLAHEMTFEESLEQIDAVGADRTILTEIEELYRRSYDDFRDLEAEYEHLGVEFAYDGMRIGI